MAGTMTVKTPRCSSMSCKLRQGANLRKCLTMCYSYNARNTALLLERALSCNNMCTHTDTLCMAGQTEGNQPCSKADAGCSWPGSNCSHSAAEQPAAAAHFIPPHPATGTAGASNAPQQAASVPATVGKGLGPLVGYLCLWCCQFAGLHLLPVRGHTPQSNETHWSEPLKEQWGVYVTTATHWTPPPQLHQCAPALLCVVATKQPPHASLHSIQNLSV